MFAVRLVVILFLLCPVAFSAISRGTWTSAADAEITGYTADAGSNRVIVYVATYESSASADKSLTGVTYGGNALTRVEYGANAGPDNFVEVWILKEANIPAGSNSFVSTHTAGGAFADRFYSAVTIIGVDQTTPAVDSGFTVSALDSIISQAITAEVDGYTVWGVSQGRPGTATWTNGPTEQTEDNGASSCNTAADKLETTAGSSNGTCEVTGANDRSMVIVAVTFSAAAAGATTTAVKRLRKVKLRKVGL